MVNWSVQLLVHAGPYAGGVRRLLTRRLLAAHIIALLAVGAATWLGLWQLDSWRANREAEAVDLTQAEPVGLADVMGPDDPFPGDRVGQPVTLSGTWSTQGTVVISDRVRDGRLGEWVVTPLLVDGAAIPVVRGWVAPGGSVPAPPAGPVDLTAWLQPSEGDGSLDEDLTDDVFPQLRVADLAQRVDADLYSAYAVAQDGVDGLASAGVAAMPSTSIFTSLRNFLYAVEWWVFGAFAALIWWRFVREDLAATPLTDPVASGA